MADEPRTKTEQPKPASDKPDRIGNGKQAQRDEAKDEGAGKKSVPIEDVTTANDK